MGRSEFFQIDDPSRVGEVRRFVHEICEELGFSETDAGRAAIVATELGTNLVRHAKNGEIQIRALAHDAVFGIELLSIDRGPGMKNVSECIEDGFSTSQTMGTGLGAIVRQSSEFDIHSIPGRGTVVMSRIWAPGAQLQPQRYQIGAVCVPMKGETMCGDAWDFREEDGGFSVALADGLGHGPLAFEASGAAIKSFVDESDLKLDESIKHMHTLLRKSRGAAVSLAKVDFVTQRVVFAGIGNVRGVVAQHQSSKVMVSHNGTVGLAMRSLQLFDYAWSTDSVLIVHSDGLQGRWDLRDYSGLLSKHASIIAAVLYRDYSRGNDDATVVVGRQLPL